MSVLIKDMGKPKFCYEVIDGEYKLCPFVITDDDCALLLNKGVCEGTWEEKYSKCPLVETPEPCEDAVSRQAAIDALADYIHNVDKVYSTGKLSADDCMDAAKSVLDDLPSVTPKAEQRWILCSERLPENDDFVVVTVLDERGDTPYRYSDFGWYLDRAKCWIIDAEQRTDVIAWCKLPEPHKGGEQDG